MCCGAVVGSGVKVNRVDDLLCGSPMEGDRDAHRVEGAERARAPWGGELVVAELGAMLRAKLVEQLDCARGEAAVRFVDDGAVTSWSLAALASASA